ncbi:MAG: hypothetical protein AAF800_08965 [Planctomycetota bacterium]
MIAWIVIAALGVLGYLLIDGDGSLPGASVTDTSPPWEPVAGFELRSLVLAERDAVLASGDLARAAAIHGRLAQEAELRAKAVMDAWMDRRHPETGLFPQAMDKPFWNYRNTAADFYGFMLHAALAFDDAEALALLRETMAKESALAAAGELCQPVRYDTAKPIREDHDERMFASTEYVKDGLISVVERTNDPAAYDRMIAVIDAIGANLRHPSPGGVLPSTRSEPNGNMLQVWSRLAFREPEKPYAELGARLADAVVTQMLPANDGLPAHYFDYENDRVTEAKTMLRDHGNELPVGLAEAYALAVSRRDDPVWQQRAERWAEPIAAMFELILTHGVNDDGLLGNTLDPATRELTDPRPSDNWGYVFCGVLLFAESARTHGVIESGRLDAMLERIDAVCAAVAQTNGTPWQGANFDGYADSIESALYLVKHRPETAALLLPWVDRQIDLMFQAQRGEGFVGGQYLDGNFIRTSLMYADRKRGGWRLEPWAPGISVGYAENRAEGEAVLHVASADGYTGRLVADRPRHAEFLGLPWDWPRLNSWPEWSVGGEAIALDLAAGEARVIEMGSLPR